MSTFTPTQPIPDSLSTLIEFMNRMERVFSQNGNNIDLLWVWSCHEKCLTRIPLTLNLGNQPSQSTASGNVPTTELPSDSSGLPAVEALSIVLRHAQHLLSDHAVPAISVSTILWASSFSFNSVNWCLWFVWIFCFFLFFFFHFFFLIFGLNNWPPCALGLCILISCYPLSEGRISVFLMQLGGYHLNDSKVFSLAGFLETTFSYQNQQKRKTKHWFID